jgi:hypothetical protein
VNLGGRVFAGANNDTMILLFSKGAEGGARTSIFDVGDYGRGLGSAVPVGERELARAATPPGYQFELRVSDELDALLEKLRAGNPRLGDICSCFQGFVTGGNDAYIVDRATIDAESLEEGLCKPAIFGQDFSRYGLPHSDHYVIYLTRENSLVGLPGIAARLAPYKTKLETKREVRMSRQPWFALHWPRVQANFELPQKILVQDIRNLALQRRIVATLDVDRHFADHTVNVLHSRGNDYDLHFILGVLNSELLNYVFGKKHIDIHVKGVYLAELPVPAIDFADDTARAKHDQMALLVTALLELTAQVHDARTDHERDTLQRRAGALDGQIDALVYELFGLDEDDMSVVEGRVQAKA